MKVRKMKRLRILILALCVCLIAGVAETLNMVDAYGEDHSNHCICGEANCTDTGHSKSTAWQKWEDVYNEPKWGIKFENTNTMYVYLTQDVAMSHRIDVEAGETLYLCLNGHKIVRNSNDSNAFEATIVVYNDANLILCDCKGTGNITHGTSNGVKYNGRGVRVGTSSDGKATFTMYGGAISGNHAGSAGGIENGRDGAGVELQNADFNMYGGKISNNVVEVASNYGGGGVYAHDGGTFEMYGGEISGNEVKGNDGGGVSMVAVSFNMYGGTISGNTASEYGGGIAAYNDNFTLTGGEIKNNSANKGGGVYMYSYDESNTLTVSGSASIIENTVNNSGNATGGGVFLNSGNVAVSGGANISGNVKGGTISNGSLSGGKANNVYLPSRRTINITGQLTGSNPIGVTTENTLAANAFVRIAQASNAEWAVPSNFTYENDSTGIFTKTSNYTTYLVACKHNYNTSWLSDDSYHWHKCSNCDEIETKTAHDYNQEIASESYLKTAATCTSKAVYYKSCACGEAGTDTFEYGNVLGHNFGVPTYNWNGTSCTAKRICSHNSSHEETETVNATVTSVQEATCTSDEMSTYTATFNNTAFTNQTEILKTGNALGHQYKKNYDASEHWNECERCSNVQGKVQHNFGEWDIDNAATCTVDGSRHRNCEDCSYIERETITKLGHKLTKVDAVSPTCTAAGNIEYYTCSNCNKWFSDADATTEITDKSSVNIPATGHSFSVTSDENQHWWKCSKCNAEKDRANHSGGTATCVETAVCTICNSKYGALNPNNHAGGREIRNALDADHNSQTAGYTGDIYCKGCNTELEKGSSISPTPHNPGDDWIKDENNHWKVCSVDGCSAILEAATHTGGEPIEENRQAATCTNDGSYDEVIYCEICHYEMSRVNKTIEALGHTWGNWSVTTTATCTAKGSEERTCSACNAKETRDIEIVPHTVSTDWSNDADNHWKICTECKAIVVDKEAHKWDAGVITTPATTTSEGVKTFTCEICKATKTESIAKIPSGGGVTPPKNDTVTVDVTGDKTSVKITAEISGDTASIAEIGRNDIDKAGAGVDIKIDLTVLPNEIAEVTVTKNSLENIYDSETDNVSIKLTETTVNMDRATLKNIIEQMNGSDLKLVVDKHQDALESMNKAQKDTLKGMKNPKLIDAYFISGGIRITDFKGGSVEIKVPYSDKKRVRAWYIDDNGKKEKVPVKYDGKTAVLTISHFSHYVIEEDSSNNVKPAHVKKTSDKVIYVRSIKYSKKTGTKITFNKVSGADGYYVYGNRCNTDKVYKFKKLATLKGNDNTVFVHKKTAKNTFYKYYIKAYRLVDGRRVTVSRSEEIHFVTDVKGYKYGNPTKVALSSKKCTLNKGKTFNLKNRVKVYSSKKVLLHTDKVRYVSSDSRVAKVNSRGRITAEKAGRCNIYAIAQNGRAAKITVTVK